MKKIILYSISFLFLIIGLSIFVLTVKQPKSIVEQKGYQFEDLDKGGVLKNLGPNVFFAFDNGDFYKVESYEGNSTYKLLRSKIPISEIRDYRLAANVLSQDFILTDTMSQVNVSAINELLLNEDLIFACKEIQYVDEIGILGAIDQSIIVFFVIGILIFIFLWVLDGFVYLSDLISGRKTRRWIEIVMLVGAVWLMQNMISASIYPSSVWAEIFRAIIMFVPVHLIYEWFNGKYFNRFEWIDGVAIRFVILLTTSCVFFLLAEKITFWYISQDFDRAISRGSELSYALAFSFAFGNLLNHVRRHLFSLRGIKKELKKSQASALESSSQYDALQSSVNPHFLYNALNSISTLATKNPKKTEEMTIALSEFYKYATNRKNTTWSTVKEEMEMIKNYIGIEKIRFEDRLDFQIQIEGDLTEERIPHFLLQPLVENAIKYGFDKTTDTIQCSVVIKKVNDQLCIDVHDNGLPFDQNMQMGFGLKNVSKKLKLLYPDRHTIEFVNNPKSVQIKLNQT